MVRAVDSGRKFLYLYIRKQIRAEVAQSVEQRTENPRVGGSIPSLGTRESTA